VNGPATEAPTSSVPSEALGNAPWLVALGNFFFKTRDALFPLVLVALFALSSPVIPHDNIAQARAVDALAVFIAVLGQVLRIAVVGYRYIVRGGRNREVYAEGLVTTGVFSLSRNPLYVGNLLILVGLLLLWHSVIGLAIGVPFFLLGYRAIVAAEETYLGKQYGAEYVTYVRNVPRWWPRLTRVAQATEGMTFNWRRVILKEYGSAAYWMAGAMVLLFFKQRRYHALEGSTMVAWPWYLALGLVVVLWAWARWLKKSKRLKE
jgi:protein-S-isoprenylcysteine O-methyltransferase Ste14